ESTVLAMEKLGAKRANIVAAIGPCIGRASYEVDAGFRERILSGKSSTICLQNNDRT
ncbi:MAG: laccase domain-containing protein, partial [Flavobacteriales bacterium]|nr:laccase domain-containing protein [Flavobacteriales bacterium]